jgi:hypothetical protein
MEYINCSDFEQRCSNSHFYRYYIIMLSTMGDRRSHMPFSYRAAHHRLEIRRHEIVRHLADCLRHNNFFLSNRGERRPDDYPRFLIQRDFRLSVFVSR